MIDCNPISPEPDVKGDISRLIKEEPLTEEQHNLADKMIDCNLISPEPDVKEDISRLIKEEPLTEEFSIKEDADDVDTIKIEQEITAMLVPKVERKLTDSELYGGFRRDVTEAVKDVLDDITESLRNDSATEQTYEGQLCSLSKHHVPSKSGQSSSSDDEDVIVESGSPSSVKNEFGNTFATSEVSKPLEVLHSREEADIAGHVCNKCDRSFSSYHGLKVHKGSCGKVMNTCCCKELGIPCSGESKNSDGQSNSNLPFRCCVCGRSYQMKRSLKDHMPTHSNVRPYNCNECSRGFKYRIHLIRHLPVHMNVSEYKHMNVKQYTCSTCSKSFLRKYSLDKHITIHSDERPFVCNECGKAFKSRQILVDHCITHSETKSFTCNSCQLSFRSRKAMYDHNIRTHSERRLKCSKCRRKFHCRKSLVRHLASHSSWR